MRFLDRESELERLADIERRSQTAVPSLGYGGYVVLSIGMALFVENRCRRNLLDV
jgi:hypothetical protein